MIEGNSVLPEESLEQRTSAFLRRRLSGEDLETLRTAVTSLYLEAGYATPWAELPDQDFVGGTLRLRVIEGHLADVVVTGNSGYRAAYVRERLMGSAGEPLNVLALERRIRRLQAEPGIRSLQATVRPGASRDAAVLFVEVNEAPRVRANLAFGDVFNPLIGEMGGHLGVVVVNPVAGRGDRLGALAGLSEGVSDLQLDYSVPIGRWGTRLTGNFRYSEAKIVDDSLSALDIRTRYLAAGLSINQPVWSADGFRLDIGLRSEWRESRSTVPGLPFGFSDASDSAGNVRDFVLRFYQEFVGQTPNQAFAFRSTWNVGLDVLGASSGSVDQAQFVSWLGQAQWLRRLEGSGIEFLARGNVQLALDPLLPFERFSVGGRSSVRGYRENQEVRDNGYSLGFDARIPLLRAPSGRTLLRAGPFVDAGRSWTEQRGEGGSHVDLVSVGIAAAWIPSSRLRFEFNYGIRLISVEQGGETSLQDHGVEFRVVAATF